MHWLESVFNEFAEGVVKEDGSEVDDEEGSSDVSESGRRPSGAAS